MTGMGTRRRAWRSALGMIAVTLLVAACAGRGSARSGARVTTPTTTEAGLDGCVRTGQVELGDAQGAVRRRARPGPDPRLPAEP